ncbi:MAG: septation ring formation regulator EzrA [Spiroplasma sp.]|nr:septation ring formation regulator EzrA [Spiroplasma sp.]
MVLQWLNNHSLIEFTQFNIILLIFASLSFAILIVATVILIIISNIKNKSNQILKNLEYCQNINLKDRLKRINGIIKTNTQYTNVFNIWINRYQKLLKKDCQDLVKDFWQVINLEKKKEYHLRNKLMTTTYRKSIATKEQVRKLLIEIDYFISIDQLIREYQLFFKQNFNYLQAEIVKTKLQNEINQEQLNEIINVLEIKFKDLEKYINQAQFSFVISTLGEIAIGTTVLAEILINLPSLSHQVYHLIPARINLIKKQLQYQAYDHNLLVSFNTLEININQQLILIKHLINQLQYKKSKNKIKEILYWLNKFNADLKEEENFIKIFNQYYQEFYDLSLNLTDIFENLNQDFDTLTNNGQTLMNEGAINNLKNITSEQLIITNDIENQITIEIDKTEKDLTYQQLLMLLRDLIENNIITFNNLTKYNQLLIEEIKPKIIINSSLNKLNSTMLQVENILSNFNYQYLQKQYHQMFLDLEAKIKNLTNKLENDLALNLNEIINQLNSLQNQSFQLYQQIKIAITFHQLANATLVYANRYRQDHNEQANLQFHNIETNIKQQNYHQALINLINLIQ